MIIGIGNDLTEIERVKKACEKKSFLNSVFTDRERELFGANMTKYAGNFAVKEAVAKCFGTGFSGFRPSDIEVLRDKAGKPYVNLYGDAEEKRKELGINNIYVTISNTKEYALATAIAEG